MCRIFYKYAGGTRWQLFGLLLVTSLLLQESVMGFDDKEEGDDCEMKTLEPGICKLANDCTALKIAIRNREIDVDDVVNCGLGIAGEIICCPIPETRILTVPNPPIPSNPAQRPLIAACKRFYKNATLEYTPHVLDGIPAKLGEFPHMAAIGFGTVADADQLDFRCGGTLIEDRFVLTAAHCVNRASLQPQMVRLGVVDFKNTEQMKHVVEIPIKQVHVHPNYTNSLKKDDIAVLELEYPCEFSENIRPTCLHTDMMDPPINSKLFVTGWGFYDRTRRTSDILLKARLEIEDIKTCELSYLKDNITLNSGHLCAIDRNFTKDACQADSGGPLNLIIDENKKIYSVVGVISAGYSCATSSPGLYARVANYLDYIEKIVWP